MLSNICPHCGKDRGNAESHCPHCEAKVENKDAVKPRSFVMIILPFVCLFGVYFGIDTVQNYLRAHRCGDFTHCQSNEKNICSGLEMYALDHKGRYPAQLQDLVPNYMKSIPTCPAAKKDTYSASYVSSKTVDAYTFICAGENHPSVVTGEYPQYNSYQGLITGK